MKLLKQAVAVTEKFGPFVDTTDGKTLEPSLTIQKAHVRLAKNGGDFGASTADQGSSDTGASYDESGFYAIAYSETDVGTLGRLEVVINMTDALYVRREYMILPANVYDSLVAGSDYLQGDMVQIEGADATGQIDARLSDYDAATGTELAAIDGKIDTIDSNVDSILTDTGTTLPATLSGIDGKIDALPTAAAIADAVYDEPKDDHTASDTFGEEIQSHSLSTELAAQENLSAAEVNAEMSDVLSVDVQALPGQGAPSNTPTIIQMLGWQYKIMRNKKDNDGETTQLYADDGSTVDAKFTTAEADGTVTIGEIESGP